MFIIIFTTSFSHKTTHVPVVAVFSPLCLLISFRLGNPGEKFVFVKFRQFWQKSDSNPEYHEFTMESVSPTDPICKNWILDELLICCLDTTSPDIRKHRMRVQKYPNVRMIRSQNDLNFFENSEPNGQIFHLPLDDVDKTLVFVGPVCQVRWGPPPGNCNTRASFSVVFLIHHKW